MLRSAPHLRRGALLIRGSILFNWKWVPALRSSAKCALHRVRDTQFYAPADAGRDAITTPASTST